MNKRILAWILLIGFVLLLLNILVFRVYMELFLVIYIIIVFAFIFSKGKLFQQDDPSDQAGPDVQGRPMNNDDTTDESSTQGSNDSSINSNDSGINSNNSDNNK